MNQLYTKYKRKFIYIFIDVYYVHLFRSIDFFDGNYTYTSIPISNNSILSHNTCRCTTLII